jgi:hypothetical protein
MRRMRNKSASGKFKTQHVRSMRGADFDPCFLRYCLGFQAAGQTLLLDEAGTDISDSVAKPFYRRETR